MGKYRKFRLIIRADSNKKIAMGHVMRCLSIADSVKSMGGDVTFVTASEDPKNLITSRGYVCIVMGTAFDDTMGELGKFLPILKGYEPDMVLCDGYYFSREYFKKVGEITKTAYIDDYGKTAYPVDLLINYNIYGDETDYRGLYARSGVRLPKLLLGTEYAPLRQAFLGAKPVTIKRNGPLKVLVSTGGADPCGMARAIVEKFLETPVEGISFGILVGPFSKDRDEIIRYADEAPETFTVYQNITDMPGFISHFDIALSAAGSTTYELCRMGIPTCLFSTADNQNRINATFKKKGICESAGNADIDKVIVLSSLFHFMKMCSSSYAYRENMAYRMKKTVDAKGAIRITDELYEML